MQSTKLPDGQITSVFQKSCQAKESKIFLFSRTPNQQYIPSIPSRSEGRIMIATKRGAGMRWTLVVPIANGARAYGKDVWS